MIGGDTRNEDWIKTLHRDLPTDVDELRRVIHGAGMSLAHFLTLPAAEAMPADLCERVEAAVADDADA